MKPFKEFLEESSLSRIKSKSDKGGMAVISGSRGDKSKKGVTFKKYEYMVDILEEDEE